MSLKIEMFDDEEGLKARLLAPLVYKATTKTEVIHINVKEGFVYDSASIPRIFWSLIGSPFSGKYRLAAAVHDALYATNYVSRKKADDMFYNIMRADGVSLWKASLMYTAVLASGGLFYSKSDEELLREREFVEVTCETIDS